MKKLLTLLMIFLHSLQAFADSLPKQPAVVDLFLYQRGDSASSPIVMFYLIDFPSGEEVAVFAHRPLIEKELLVASFHLDDQGVIYMGGSKKSFIGVEAWEFFQGERVIFSFVSKGQLLVDVSLIPNVIAVRDAANKFALEAELITLNPAVYLVSVAGLEEGESYLINSKSCDELIRAKRTFRYGDILSVSPDVIGKTGGIGKFSITARNKKLSIKLPWGKKIRSQSTQTKLSNGPKKPSLNF